MCVRSTPELVNERTARATRHLSWICLRTVEIVFGLGWAGFWAYWLVAAFSMKTGHVPWSRELPIRAVILVLVIVLFRLGVFQRNGFNSNLVARRQPGSSSLRLDLRFAVWARVHIGRNRGTPMSQKADPELRDKRSLSHGPPSRLLGHPPRGHRHPVALAGLG